VSLTFCFAEIPTCCIEGPRPTVALFPVLLREAAGDAGEIETRNAILQRMCPAGTRLEQDLVENRFVATYKRKPPTDRIVHELSYNQGIFGRSYKNVRSTRDALELVLEWVWGKHQFLTGEASPSTSALLDALIAEEREFLLAPEMGTLVRGRR
jgi:hypothetical protein